MFFSCPNGTVKPADPNRYDGSLLASFGISGVTYQGYIPLLPVHGGPTPATRQYLFFDWSVRSVRTSK